MRCLALAKGIEHAGSKAIFVCRELQGNLCDKIAEQGFTILRLPVSKVREVSSYNQDTTCAAWLETSWQVDAAETNELLQPLAPFDWLIVDHYALDARWESAVRSLANNLMAIDDLFDRSHDVDLLLNQNILDSSKLSYRGLLPSGCRQVLGPCYALIQNDFKKFRNQIPPRSGKISRVLVYFGGVDAPNLTGRSLDALRAAGCGDLAIDVVLPVLGPHTESVIASAARLSGTRIYEALPSLTQLMANADLTIGAGGTTSWERLCMGLPTLVVTLSDNQLMIAKELHDNGLINWLGHHDEVTVEFIADTLGQLLHKELSSNWSERCRAVVDGNGVERVVALMEFSPLSRLTSRAATVDDEVLVGDWLMPIINCDNLSYREMLRTLYNDRLYLVEVAPDVIIGAVLCTQRKEVWQLRTLVSPAVGSSCSVQRLEETVLHQMRSDIEGLLLFAPNNAATTKGLLIAVCSDKDTWINDFIPAGVLQWLGAGHILAWAHDAKLLPESQICFYLGYSSIVSLPLRARHCNNLVVHESDLPYGRGWSPLTWQVLQGAYKIVVTLFEAVDALDAGVIYSQTVINLRGDELVGDLRLQQARATFLLCTEFIAGYPGILNLARQQKGTPSYFPRRKPADSRIDLDLPLRDQFNLLRVCDNIRYPAWFEHAGTCYKLSISRAEQDNDEN
jgi:UDP-2,4-diacetamido-2,4,6-trideoxy-beta-L-altropyranose hydrolase